MHGDVVLWSSLLLLITCTNGAPCPGAADQSLDTDGKEQRDGDCKCNTDKFCFTEFDGERMNYGCAMANKADEFKNTKFFNANCNNCHCEETSWIVDKACSRTKTALSETYCCSSTDGNDGKSKNGEPLQLFENSLCEDAWIGKSCSDTTFDGDVITDASLISLFCDTGKENAQAAQCLCCNIDAGGTGKIAYGERNLNRNLECAKKCSAPTGFPEGAEKNENKSLPDGVALVDGDDATSYFQCTGSGEYKKSTNVAFKCVVDGETATWSDSSTACELKSQIEETEKTEIATFVKEYWWIGVIVGSVVVVLVGFLIGYYCCCHKKQLERADKQMELHAPTVRSATSPRESLITPEKRVENAKRRWKNLRLVLNVNQKLHQDKLKRAEVEFLESKFDFFARQGTSMDPDALDESSLTIFFIQAQPTLSYRDAKKLARAILQTHPTGLMSRQQFLLAYQQEYRRDPNEVWSQLSNLGYTPGQKSNTSNPRSKTPTGERKAPSTSAPKQNSARSSVSESHDNSQPTNLYPDEHIPDLDPPDTPGDNARRDNNDDAEAPESVDLSQPTSSNSNLTEWPKRNMSGNSRAAQRRAAAPEEYQGAYRRRTQPRRRERYENQE